MPHPPEIAIELALPFHCQCPPVLGNHPKMENIGRFKLGRARNDTRNIRRPLTITAMRNHRAPNELRKAAIFFTKSCLPGGAICRHVLACSAIVLVLVVCWGRDDDGAKAIADDAAEATATVKCARRERTIVTVSLLSVYLVGRQVFVFVWWPAVAVCYRYSRNSYVVCSTTDLTLDLVGCLLALLLALMMWQLHSLLGTSFHGWSHCRRRLGKCTEICKILFLVVL